MQTKLSLFCDRVIEAGWLAALILVPVFFNIYSARTFEPDKLTLMRSIALVMALAWLIKVAETGVTWSSPQNEDNGKGEETPARPGRGITRVFDIPLFLPTLLLVLAYLISTIFSISPKVALWGSYQRLQGTYTALSYIVIFTLMATHLRSRAQVDRLVTTVILTSLPVGLYGIIQRYGLDPLPWAGDVTRRVASNMGNAIFVASYLIMVIPLALARLLSAMEAILDEEEASWGHTVLAAVYIFILAVDLITVLFSQSRGPLLGLLAGLFFFLFLGLLALFRRRARRSPLTLADGLRSVFETMALISLGGVLGAVGYRLIGPKTPLDLWAFVAAGILLGVVINVLGLAVRAALRRSWPRLWLNWVLLAVFMAGFLVALNLPGSPFLSLRPLPMVGRLTQLFQPGEGTGRVRVLIWQGVLDLIAPHEPLGIPGEFTDRLNLVRPLIGYGPESMFNAFAKVYPPELAHVEKRGSSADRSHNETFDLLAVTGIFGFAAYYFLMFSLFYYLLKTVGWIPDSKARRRLLVLLGLGGVLGVSVPRLVTGHFVFVGLGLPAGMLFAIFVYLIWQAVISAGEEEPESEAVPFKVVIPADTRQTLLLLGVFTALVAHFVEVHFVFSIAATYIYFWAYAGLVVARMRWAGEPEDAVGVASEVVEAKVPQTAEISARKRRRRRQKSAALETGGLPSKSAAGPTTYEDWETWLGVLGLVVAIILVAMIFDFVTAQFDISRGSFSIVWMFGIVWGLGLAVALGEVAIREPSWQKPVNWGRALLLYAVTSLGYSAFYLMVHRWQIRPRNLVAGADPAEAIIKGARIYTGTFLSFYLFVFILILLIAAMLAMPFLRRQPAWRTANWWLYPVLILATGVGIMFKNVDVVRADMYLKQGEQYRNQGEYDNAILLHEQSVRLDPDEDFYYLMLALDYQLKGQDNRISDEERARAWVKGEQIALQARQINLYNPDNTGNMGRYYLTWAQVSAPNDPQQSARFQKALEYFEKTTKLAPQNVVYYNLWAQTHYMLGQYERAVELLQTSVALDSEFEQTQMLLGDTYAAMGLPLEALKAHWVAIRLSPGVFADHFFDQRLDFYLSASRSMTGSVGQGMSPIEGIISAFEEAQSLRPKDIVVPQALGRIYARMGDQQKAIEYYQQAMRMGDKEAQTAMAMADIYLGLKDYEQAANAYEQVLQRDPQNLQAHSNLGYVYAQMGRLDEAIQENLQVLQLNPGDYISHRNLALLYRDKGRVDDAIGEAQQVVELSPENERGTAYMLLGSLYEASGKTTQAIEAYEQAVTAASDLYQAQVALGNLYLQGGRLEDALSTFQKITQLKPDDYAIHQQLALIYRQLGRYDEALAEANRALSLAPEDMHETLKSLVAQIESEKG